PPPGPLRPFPPVPTRRSSDLHVSHWRWPPVQRGSVHARHGSCTSEAVPSSDPPGTSPVRRPSWQTDQSADAEVFHAVRGVHDSRDRKSTRLNSSHVNISHAVF